MILKFQGSQTNVKTFGDSMFPFFKDGDILTVKKISFKKIQVNDFVTFKRKTKLVTHRVIYKAAKYFVTKGDNNYYADGKISPRQIIGKVEKVKRGNKIFNPEDIYLFQSQLYFNQIIKIKKDLEQAKVVFVFLKGLPVYFHYEKTHPRRFFADCDILIDKSSIEKIDRIFIRAGFKREKKHQNSPLSEIEKIAEIPYYKTVNTLLITFDVHLEPAFLTYHRGKFNALYPQKMMDNMTYAFLKERGVIKTHNEFFPVLCAKHQILYLALHSFHHNYKEIFRIEFLYKVLSYYKSKRNTKLVEDIVDEAFAYKIQNYVYPCFYFLDKYYSNSYAKKIARMIKPTQNKMRYVKKILKEDIANSDDIRLTYTKHALNLFFLTEEPFYKKILVFLSPSVILSLLKLPFRYFHLSKIYT